MIKKYWKALFLSILLSSSGCSVLLDFEECQATPDCTEAFGAAAVCQEGVCDVPTLTSANCKTSLGTPGAPNTLTIGVILALSGDEAGFGNPLKNAIEVAYNDLEKLKINGSDLAVLFCDNQSTEEGSLVAAKHLAEVVKVPAIIGPEFSDHIKPILEGITRESKTVVISPSATAALISDLDDKDLVWRTAPSDVFQAEAIAKLLGATTEALTAASKPTDNIWVLTADDSIYTSGLRDGLTENVPASISPNYLNYPKENFGAWVTENLSDLPRPNIVVILGFAEAWDLANAIDGFSGSDPIFIFADGAKNQSQAAKKPDLAKRILGTAPQSVGDEKYAPYTAFRTKFQSAGFRGEDQAQFLPHAYDAFYVIALAAGANGFTGPEIARGLKRLSAGEKIKPTQAGVEKAFNILRKSSKATIDYEGASGRLDFAANGDPSRGLITLWCFDGTELGDQNTLLNEDNVFTFQSDVIFSAVGCLESLTSK